MYNYGGTNHDKGQPVSGAASGSRCHEACLGDVPKGSGSHRVCCLGKKRLSKNNDKDAIIKRLKRIEGQVKGIQKMVEEERYCVDILTQISAIRSAINKVGSIILENHMKGCVSQSIKQGDSEEMIDELMKTIDKFVK